MPLVSQAVPLRHLGRQAGTQVSFKSNGGCLTTIPESLGYLEGKSTFVFHAVLTLRIAHRMFPSFHTRISTVGSLKGGGVGIHAQLGLTSASMGQPVKKKAVYFSRLGCCSFSHLLFTVLLHAFDCNFYENLFVNLQVFCKHVGP